MRFKLHNTMYYVFSCIIQRIMYLAYIKYHVLRILCHIIHCNMFLLPQRTLSVFLCVCVVCEVCNIFWGKKFFEVRWCVKIFEVVVGVKFFEVCVVVWIFLIPGERWNFFRWEGSVGGAGNFERGWDRYVWKLLASVGKKI